MPAERIIPLDVAHQVLATFGINESTPLYDRRVRADGFRVDDLHEILDSESRFIFIVDWRAALPEELKPIATAVKDLGADLKIDVDPDADDGWVECGGKRESVKYVPSDQDDFTDVIRALQKVLPTAIEFREGITFRGSDTWEFAALLREEWSALESLDRTLIQSLFEPMPLGGGHNPTLQRTGAAGIVSRARKWFGRGPGR